MLLKLISPFKKDAVLGYSVRHTIKTNQNKRTIYMEKSSFRHQMFCEFFIFEHLSFLWKLSLKMLKELDISGKRNTLE